MAQKIRYDPLHALYGSPLDTRPFPLKPGQAKGEETPDFNSLTQNNSSSLYFVGNLACSGNLVKKKNI